MRTKRIVVELYFCEIIQDNSREGEVVMKFEFSLEFILKSIKVSGSYIPKTTVMDAYNSE